MPTPSKPTIDMIDTFEEARQKYHAGRLVDVTFDYVQLKASKNKEGEPRGAALRWQHTEALVAPGIRDVADRWLEFADVRVQFNGDLWEHASDEDKIAACDKVLTAITAHVDDNGDAKRDEADRPKLSPRRPDVQISLYHDVAKRHGKAAPGVKQLRRLIADTGQVYLPWLEDTSDVPMLTPARGKKSPPPRIAAKPVKYKTGKAKVRVVKDRLQHVKMTSTLLGVLQLEVARSEKQQRAKIIADIKAKLLEAGEIAQANVILQGGTSDEADLAAAVILTTKGLPEMAALDVLVQECSDPDVLEDVIEEEKAGEARDEVIDSIAARIAELRADAAEPGPAANVEPPRVVH